MNKFIREEIDRKRRKGKMLIDRSLAKVCCAQVCCQRSWFAETLMRCVVYKTRRRADRRMNTLEASSAAAIMLSMKLLHLGLQRRQNLSLGMDSDSCIRKNSRGKLLCTLRCSEGANLNSSLSHGRT